ncbi:MAG: hypothetical protein GXP24_08335 [Planctomycetes bacterium]|nr:hypothetical protein [Planctomycetota bacterium]
MIPRIDLVDPVNPVKVRFLVVAQQQRWDLCGNDFLPKRDFAVLLAGELGGFDKQVALR